MILHVDMDAFYASVEEREHPKLRGQPVIVGGTPEGRGVVAAANYEARKFGVHSAMPAARAKRVCPHAVFLPSRLDFYSEVSRQIRDIFHRFTPLVEPLSLDEAFLDATGSGSLFGSSVEIGQQIKQEISDSLQLVASVGVAPNKFLAKVASDWNKPNGQYVVTPDRIDAFLAKLPVSKIWGVGKVTARRLEQKGITTCEDVRAYDVFQFVELFGSFGEHIHKLAHGIDDRPVVSEWRRKSISVENTYAEDLPDLATCLEKIPQLIVSLDKRMEKLDDDYLVHNSFVKMKFRDFSQTTVERLHSNPVMADLSILCEEAWQRGKIPVRLLGVGVRLTDLTESGGQMELFEKQTKTK